MGPCPASIVQLTRSATDPFSTDAIVFDSTYVDAYTAHVQFDRLQGRTSLSASSGGRLTASSRVVERFDVTGVAPGTPVDATLEFRLAGWAEQNCGGSGCGVLFEATLVVGPDSVTADANQIGPGYLRRDLPGVISLPVHFVAGSPIEAQFFLRFGTGPGGSATAEVDASYGVSGLPSGVNAAACPGAIVTPLRRATWGSLKLLYR